MMITIHIPPNHFCLSYRYPGLGIREIREFLDEHHPHVYNYLPEPDLELPKVPKEWFVNVCATVLQDKFSKWIKDGVDKRHDKVKVKKDIDIDVDPEIAEVFHRSNAVSSKCSYSFILFKLFGSYIASKGISAKLLQKGSKRRRTKQQIEDEKQAAFLKEQ